MRADIYPLQILLLTISGWVNRRQGDVIAYLLEENQEGPRPYRSPRDFSRGCGHDFHVAIA